MMQPDASSTESARKALDKLVQQYLRHPAVSLIDMGEDPEHWRGEPSSTIVLRLHVRPGADLDAMHIPAEIDGIPVRIITADYHLE